MLIEFECPNLLDFDKEQREYVTCGERLIASDEKIGEQILCDKCGQMVEVPYEAFNKPRSAEKKPVQAPVGAAKSVSDSSDEFRLMDPIARPASDVMTYDFDASTESEAFENDQLICPKCGCPLDDLGHCTECRYVKPSYESEHVPLTKLKLRPAGFQKWCLDMMSEGVPFPVLVGVSHILALLFTAALLTVSFFIAPPISVILGVAAVGIALLYAGFVFKAYQLARNPNAKLAWFQKPFWNGILMMARQLKWYGYDKRFKGRIVIDVRGEGLVDDNVKDLPDIKKCSVLDLEGTLVSDKTLPELYGLKYLQCVVLRRTRVTHEAVVRLQQANPRLWIWH